MRRFVWLFVLALVSVVSLSVHAGPIVIGTGQSFHQRPILADIEIFEDEDRRLTIETLLQTSTQLEWRTIQDQGVTIFDKGAFWIRFDLDNRGPATERLVLEHAYPFTDQIELFVVQGDGTKRLGVRGDTVTYTQDETPYRQPIFTLDVPPGTHRYFLRLVTDGPANPKFYLWNPTAFNKHVRGETLLLGFLFGFVAIMIGYNAFLAIRLRNPAYYLYVGYILSFSMVQFIWTGMGKMLLPAHPNISFLLHWGIVPAAELTGIFGALFAIPFLNLRTRAPWLYRCLLLYFGMALANSVFSLIDYDTSVGIVLFTNGYVSLLLVLAGVYGCVQRYRPAYFYTVAWLFIIVGSLVSMGQIYGLLPTTQFTIWSQFIGGAIEVMLLSLALGDKISLEQEKAHASISQLNSELNQANDKLKIHIENVEAMVDEKTRDIRSMLLTIRQGIFMISSHDGKVMPDYSRHLTTILERNEISGATVQELLFTRAQLNTDTLDQTQAALASALGNDVLNFEVNQSLLVHEFVWLDQEGKPRTFEVDWSPVVDDAEQVEKILVTLRDVTHIRTLERLQAEQKREMEAIRLILGLAPDKFDGFLASCQDFLKNCLMTLKNDPSLQIKTLGQIYINVHTIKGMARSFRFSELSARIHDLESLLDQIRKDRKHDGHSLAQQIASHISDIQEKLSFLDRINREKLGRGQSQHENGAANRWIRQKIMHLRALDSDTMPQEQRVHMRKIIEEMEEQSAVSLDKAIEEVAQNLGNIALDLGKASPRLILHCKTVRLTSVGQHLVENTFLHLFNNALDHGIETPDDRERRRKPRRGEIHIEAQITGQRLLVTFEDDGRGLDLPRIFAKACENKLLSPETTPDRITLARLIFEPGFSTTEGAGLTSGRGVGMDAVRTYLHNEKSSIDLVLLDEGLKDPTALAVVPFRFMLTLAPHLFLAAKAGSRQVA